MIEAEPGLMMLAWACLRLDLNSFLLALPALLEKLVDAPEEWELPDVDATCGSGASTTLNLKSSVQELRSDNEEDSEREHAIWSTTWLNVTLRLESCSLGSSGDKV